MGRLSSKYASLLFFNSYYWFDVFLLLFPIADHPPLGLIYVLSSDYPMTLGSNPLFHRLYAVDSD
jgi:hypothetical protein